MHHLFLPSFISIIPSALKTSSLLGLKLRTFKAFRIELKLLSYFPFFDSLLFPSFKFYSRSLLSLELRIFSRIIHCKSFHYYTFLCLLFGNITIIEVFIGFYSSYSLYHIHYFSSFQLIIFFFFFFIFLLFLDLFLFCLAAWLVWFLIEIFYQNSFYVMKLFSLLSLLLCFFPFVPLFL